MALVGAGPGDPGLITARGLELLRRCDAVVFDALANPALLAEAPPAAERHDVGKRAGHHKKTQDETNALLAELAEAGKAVVRLKGGDPYVFGRGGEEAIYLGERGIPVEVVPGVTAGIAAAATAGVPVTHRGVSPSITLVTGHEDPAVGETSLDYRSLAGLIAAGGTVAFYMGVGRLPAIAAALAEQGADPATPAAVVQWGTLPRQRHVKATLATVAEAVDAAGLASPAMILVGRSAGLNEPGLDGFTARPLFGQTVLVTRTRQQASRLAAALAEQGARVLEAPTIVTGPPDDPAALDDAVRDIPAHHWLALTSTNAVAVLAERLDALKLDARHLAGVRLAAVGRATADALWGALRVRADLVPADANGGALAAALLDAGAGGRRVMLLRADIARPALPTALAEAGCEVAEAVAYRTRRADALPDEVLDALRRGEVDWVTFTSGSTARNLVALLGDQAELLRRAEVASIGPVTSVAAREAGLHVAVEAGEASIEALVDAVVEAVRPSRPG